MTHPHNIDGFRAIQMIQDKAQSEENGYVLFKGCNAVLDHLGSSLRAGREAVTRGVAALGKGVPLPASRAFRLTASRLAESANIMRMGH